MPDLENLPYTENGGYAPRFFRVITYVAAGAMLACTLLALKFPVVPSYSFVEIMTPITVLGVLLLLHHCVRAAVHEAIRMSDADDALDAMVLEQVEREAKRTLTPLTLSRQMDESLP